MATYFIKEETLTSIANETRGLLGSTDKIQGVDLPQALGEANAVVAEQDGGLRALLEAINNLSSGGGSSANLATGTVTSNDIGAIRIPKANFEPKQIMVWNVQERDDLLDDYIAHDGVMLCAVKMPSGHWVAHYMGSMSGVYYIAQASAENRSHFQNEPGYGATNIEEGLDAITWVLGGDNSEGGINDFTDITLNYVLIG
jgi:hypothetical protein